MYKISKQFFIFILLFYDKIIIIIMYFFTYNRNLLNEIENENSLLNAQVIIVKLIFKN